MNISINVLSKNLKIILITINAFGEMFLFYL